MRKAPVSVFASLKEEFQRTLRRWKKQALDQPLRLDDISHVESQSFSHSRHYPGERGSLSYEARRAAGPDSWNVSLVTVWAIAGGHGISVHETASPVEGGQGLPITGALDLITRLSPPGIRQAADAWNRPAKVAEMIGHRLPGDPAPRNPAP